MTDPTKESLNEDAIAAGFLGWESAQNILRKRGDTTAFGSIIAHAHTLDKLHGRTPVDPLVQVFRSLPLNSDAGCDKLTDAEWHVVATAARKTLAALRRGMELVLTPRMPTEAETREACARYYEIRGWLTDAKSIRANNQKQHDQVFHTAVTELFEKMNEREGV